MRSEQVHGVMEAAAHVFERAAKIRVKLIRITWSEGLSGLPPLSAGVGIEGGVQGAMCLLLERNVARDIARNMTGDAAMAQAEDAELAPIVMELLNMIAGNAVGLLSPSGSSCTVTPPVILSAQGEYFNDCRLALLHMESDAGRFHMAMFLHQE